MTAEPDVTSAYPRAESSTANGAVATLAVAAAIGVGLGLFSWWADLLSWFGIPEGSAAYVAFGALQVLGNGPTLWLLGAFAVGAVAARPGVGALLGTASLLLAVGVYYALIVLLETRPGADVGRAALAWAAVAALAGPVMGAAGGAVTSRPATRWRWIGAAVAGGALIGIGLFALPYSLVAAVPHLAAGIAAGAVLAGSGRRLRAGVAAVVLGAVAFGVVQLTFVMVGNLLRA